MFKEKGLMDEITDYIKKNLKKGYTQDSLKYALINQGYSKIKYEIIEPKQAEQKSFWQKLLDPREP